MPRSRSPLAAAHPPRRPFAALAALLAAVASAGALAGCDLPASFAQSSRAGAGDSVYIGVAAMREPATESFFRGARLAVARLNAERPAGARPFAVAMPPVEQPTQVAVAVAFRDDPRVVAVVGHTGSAQTMEAAPVYADVEDGGRRALAAVSPTATNPAVTLEGDWVFRVCPTDVDGARALARFAVDSAGVRRVAVIYRNDLFGRGFTRALARELTTGGARVVERDPYLSGITEFGAYAARATGRDADAIMLAGGGPDAVQIIRALRAAGGTARILGSDDLASLNDAPSTATEFRGTRFITFYSAALATGAEATAFLQGYRAAHRVTPTHQAALTYDAAMLIGRAVLAVGADRRRVRDRIAATGMSVPAHQGATGPIRFDARGDVVDKPVFIGEVTP